MYDEDYMRNCVKTISMPYDNNNNNQDNGCNRYENSSNRDNRNGGHTGGNSYRGSGGGCRGGRRNCRGGRGGYQSHQTYYDNKKDIINNVLQHTLDQLSYPAKSVYNAQDIITPMIAVILFVHLVKVNMSKNDNITHENDQQIIPEVPMHQITVANEYELIFVIIHQS
eukprot:392499_1